MIIIKNADIYNQIRTEEIINLTIFTIAMIAYVGYFSVLRFKRESFERKQFEKISILTETDTFELAQELKNTIL